MRKVRIKGREREVVDRFHLVSYIDYIQKILPEHFEKKGTQENGKNRCKTVTFKVTDDCNLRCTYCYQIKKQRRTMSWETAKKFVDFLLDSTPDNNPYINAVDYPGIVIDFIGGEPLLEIELIEKICDYIEEQLILRKHPWLETHRYSICSNGILYQTPKVQKFLEKYGRLISFSITIDGNQELHDACRVFPDGKPSYQIVVEAVRMHMKKNRDMGSKVTFAPGNLAHVSEAMIHMLELGFRDIHANCVFEDVWDNEVHPKIFYEELKKLADYYICHDLVEKQYISLFEEGLFCPMEEEENTNWCGGDGQMLACDTEGILYPCIRFMESSLGTEQKPMVIGNLKEGIANSTHCQECLSCLKGITRKSQSTEECFSCPVAKGCAWCTAFNYQVFGTPNKRTTYSCGMHKARALANVYFWNSYYRKKGLPERMNCYLPYLSVSQIIDKEEYDRLIELSKEGGGVD